VTRNAENPQSLLYTDYLLARNYSSHHVELHASIAAPAAPEISASSGFSETGGLPPSFLSLFSAQD
jgi:hypothetical protein